MINQNCTHKERSPDVWVEATTDEWDQIVDAHWEYGKDKGTCEDIDLNRFRCTQCGEVFSYSCFTEAALAKATGESNAST